MNQESSSQSIRSVQDGAAPFPSSYFDTVFLVPAPPANWPRQFAIVTAHDPGGKHATERANNQAERELNSLLRAQGIESFPVIGASRDLSHHESGRGFQARDLAEAAKISDRFQQLAFFWVEDGMVFLCVDDSGRGWKMASWEDRLVGSPPR